MTPAQMTKLQAVNDAEAKLQSDTVLWGAAKAKAALSKAIYDGLVSGNEAQALAQYQQDLSDAYNLQTLVQITDTVAFKTAADAFNQETNNPGAIVG